MRRERARAERLITKIGKARKANSTICDQSSAWGIYPRFQDLQEAVRSLQSIEAKRAAANEASRKLKAVQERQK